MTRWIYRNNFSLGDTAGNTAANRAMTFLKIGEEKFQSIKMLSDSCRMLTHLHQYGTDTEAGMKMVKPGLEKSFLTIRYKG